MVSRGSSTATARLVYGLANTSAASTILGIVTTPPAPRSTARRAFPRELLVGHAHQPEVIALKVLQVADHALDAILHLRVGVGPVVAPTEPLPVRLFPALVPGFLIVLGPVLGLVLKPACAVVLLPGIALRAVERGTSGVHAIPEIVDEALVFARP